MARIRCYLLVASLIVATAATLSADEAVSFRRDVMAVFSKAGCNQGTCHGNASGKGGLKLSLRGESPADDLLTLTHIDQGRRVNRLDPASSLLLLKPTARVPHVGGRRFSVDSPAYRILREWIADGAGDGSDRAARLTSIDVSPADAITRTGGDAVDIRVMAHFADGGSREVTELAVFEPSEPTVSVDKTGRVMPTDASRLTEVTIGVRYLDQQRPVRVTFLPPRSGFVWQEALPDGLCEIDIQLNDKLQQLELNPSAVCDDATFVRRLFLDLTGQIPTAEEARAFVESTAADKRARLIDDLLTRQEFAIWWTLKWSDLLRNEEKVLDRKGIANFQAWIRAAISGGLPLNEFARQLLASRGSTYAVPAANYYRAMRDPIMRAESAAQVFLGVRLQCAKCHNHPFDRWTQDDYYGWASLFARVDYKLLENDRRDSNDKHEFIGEQIVYQTAQGHVTHPRSGDPVAPRLLAGMQAAPAGRSATSADSGDRPEADDRDTAQAGDAFPEGSDELAADPLTALADWMAAADNRQFARVQVNRIWAELMGRGLVEPVDDFRSTNPASHPRLLEWLAEDFIKQGDDLRHTVRLICNSRAYQRSAVPTSTNAEDERNFSHAVVRRLSAEQLLDSLSLGLDVPLEFTGYPVGLRAAELPGAVDVSSRQGTPSAASEFLILFGKPPRLQACACERSDETTLAQSFQLISGPLLHQMLQRPGNRLDTLAAADEGDIVEALYWSLLTRPPTSEERTAISERLARAADRRQTIEDVAWALINSGEFLLRR